MEMNTISNYPSTDSFYQNYLLRNSTDPMSSSRKFQKCYTNTTTTPTTPHDDFPPFVVITNTSLAEHNMNTRAEKKSSHHNLNMNTKGMNHGLANSPSTPVCLYQKDKEADVDTTASSLEATCRNLEQALSSLEADVEEDEHEHIPLRSENSPGVDDAFIFDPSTFFHENQEKKSCLPMVPEQLFLPSLRKNTTHTNTDGSLLTTTPARRSTGTIRTGSMTGRTTTPTSSVKVERALRQSAGGSKVVGGQGQGQEGVEKGDKGGQAPSLLYRTKLCSYFSAGKCKRGGNCSYAHDEKVLRPRPDLAKTQLCNILVTLGRCPSGSSCPFAHSQADLKVVELSQVELDSFQSNIVIKKITQEKARAGSKENGPRGQSETDKEKVVAQEGNAAVGNVGKNKMTSGKKKIVNKSMSHKSAMLQYV